ncbi:MAG: hypothetical protein K9M84_10535 [Spirochaetia bacterium]|nr:hypothetical protein [Spirochaetia bacterium]
MIWFIVIVAVIIIVRVISTSRAAAEQKHTREWTIDDQDPANPMYEEMQEEFFDEFGDDDR